jgi:hypothetical protein
MCIIVLNCRIDENLKHNWINATTFYKPSKLFTKKGGYFMKRLVGISFSLLCSVSCSKINDNPSQSMEFNPIYVTAKWTYSYSNNFFSHIYTRQESGYREIVIESKASYKDSTVYKALVSDSIEIKIIQTIGGSPEITQPFSLKYNIDVIEYINGTMRIRYNSNNDGRRDDMIDYAFRRRIYPDSLIKLDTIFGEPSYSVTLYQVPSAVYFRDIGMESYYINGCSGGQSCITSYKLKEYSLKSK